MFGSIGKALNQITGATNSSNAAFSQSRMLANMSYAQQKEFAQNQVQWYADDLEKAGYNRALSTGASSAGSGGSIGNSGNTGTGNLLDVVGMINNTRLTNAQIDKINAETDNIDEDTEIKGTGIIGATLGTQNVKKFRKRVETEKNSAKKLMNKSAREHWNDFKKHIKENTPLGMLIN